MTYSHVCLRDTSIAHYRFLWQRCLILRLVYTELFLDGSPADVDTVMQRFLEIISAIPSPIVLVMLLVLKPGLVSIIIAIALLAG